MGTIRISRRQRFTTVDRRTINDARLSFRARGLLVWLLDKPDDWRVNSSDIANAGTEGRDAVRAALAELERHGYLVRHRVTGPRGRWCTDTVVYELPVTEDGFPGVGGPGVGKPGANTKTETEDCLPPKPPRAKRTKPAPAITERRDYDSTPLTPEQIAEKYGCES